MNPLLGKNGGLAGSITAVQCPDVQCSYVKFRAVYNNTGIVAIGHDLQPQQQMALICLRVVIRVGLNAIILKNSHIFQLQRLMIWSI